MLHTPFKTNRRGLQPMTILLSQVPLQLIKPVLLGILTFLQHLQFHHQKLSLLKCSPVHLKVISPTKATAHEALMFSHIIDSALV